jgi:signal transduction histidine kinase/AraC-like DNA-binding protein
MPNQRVYLFCYLHSMRVIVLFCLLSFCLTVAKCQFLDLDSLKSELKKSKSDTLTVYLLAEIGTEYLNNYPDSAKLMIEKAYRLSTEINYIKGQATSLNYLGRYYARIGQYSKGADCFLKCLTLQGYFNENKVRTTTYYDLGQLYASISSLSGSKELYNKRVYFFKKSIESFRLITPTERKGDFAMLEAAANIELARTYMNILIDTTKLDSAVYFFKRASQLATELGSFEVTYSALEGMGNAYLMKHQFKDAIQIGYQLLSLSNSKSSIGYYRAMSFMKLGEFYKTDNKFDSANYYLNKSLKEIKRMGNDYEFLIPGLYGQLGQLYQHHHRYAEAIRYFTLQIESEKKLNIANIELTYTNIAESYNALGNYKKASEFFSRYIMLKDSLVNEDTSAKLARLQGDFELARQADQIELLKKESQVQVLLITQKQNQQLLISLGVLFLLIVIGMLIWRNRLIQKSKTKQQNLFTEMDQLKSRFFANISHEFRTPLTLLLAPIEKQLALLNTSETKLELEMMHRNASRLLTLVNQLLDLSRFEARTMGLHASHGEIVRFIIITMSEFQSMADSKNLRFELRSTVDSLEMYFDEDKLKKVLSNLFSNAFKFTPEGGEIVVDVKKCDPTKRFANGYVEIIIKDDGIGIESQHLPRIFERFYQVDTSATRSFEGTGIGLGLTKELIELHYGAIAVESQIGVGSTFSIQLPLGKDHLRSEETITKMPQNFKNLDTPIGYSDIESVQGDVEHGDVVLVIEDNEDLRQHLQRELSNSFKITLARDGEEGVQLALEKIPSLIISDLMMPKKDGISVCAQLKDDERTSHIPFILLTAKTEVESRLDGFRKGADDYIAKPFSMNELIIRVQNLIDSRKKLQRKYAQQSVVLYPSDLKAESIEEKFLKKVGLVVEKYLSDPMFSVEIFASEVGMSQVQLYRKLTALTNYSPNEFIRHMRLQRASDLLKQNVGNVAEVAYQSGFNNMSYFSKVFKEKFGVTPSEFNKQK